MFKAVVSVEIDGRGLAVVSVSMATHNHRGSIYTVAYATALLEYVH